MKAIIKIIFIKPANTESLWTDTALMMGLSRVLYSRYGDRIKLDSAMKCSAAACVLSYVRQLPSASSARMRESETSAMPDRSSAWRPSSSASSFSRRPCLVKMQSIEQNDGRSSTSVFYCLWI